MTFLPIEITESEREESDVCCFYPFLLSTDSNLPAPILSIPASHSGMVIFR